MSTQPQQPQPQHTDATDATVHAHGQGNSTSTSISNAMSNPSNASASDGVESVRKPEPGSTVDQTTIDQSKVQVPSTGANPNPNNPEVPFKERVIGVAKKTRGTILNKPEVKEHGERILQGSASVYDATGRSV